MMSETFICKSNDTKLLADSLMMLLIRFTPGHELVGLQVVAEDGLINNKEGCLGQEFV